tara:strand:- start:221 stop:529 length:309 start_codon:yes stop_codon:yes gene_type:complete
MTHISHMPREAHDAYNAGDVDALKAIYNEKLDFCRSIERIKSVPYAESQRFGSVSAYQWFHQNQSNAMFTGVMDLMGAWEEYWAGKFDMSRLDRAIVLGSTE